jgi:hypothetical protein
MGSILQREVEVRPQRPFNHPPSDFLSAPTRPVDALIPFPPCERFTGGPPGTDATLVPPAQK